MTIQAMQKARKVTRDIHANIRSTYLNPNTPIPAQMIAEKAREACAGLWLSHWWRQKLVSLALNYENVYDCPNWLWIEDCKIYDTH